MTVKVDTSKTEIEEVNIERARNMAESLAKVSNGFITQRQALAAILFYGSKGTISFLEQGLSGGEVSEIMGISRDSVYKGAKAGEDKLIAAKLMVEVVEDVPWWATESASTSE